MIRIRRSEDRGQADHGWLRARHTFSFAGYRDPDHTGFRGLRVINEDRVAPGRGFGTHPHENMEIITYVLDGHLRHEDSTGEGGVLEAGELQRMSAGRGIAHSEVNASETEPVHLYQIWIRPAELDIEPGYEQARFDDARGRLRLVASPSAEEGSLAIHADARVYLARLDPGDAVEHSLRDGRHAWVQVVRGEVSLDGETLATGDGAAVSDEPGLSIEAGEEAEVLVFDLA